jgi:hypothetical protein
MEMNLPETLVFSDITHLNRIAKEYQIEVNSSSKNELIQSILQQVLNQNQIMVRLQHLSSVEKVFLLFLLLDTRKGISYEDLLAKARQAINITANGEEPTISNRTLISNMLNCGWIFQDKRKHGTLYQIPVDLRSRLLKGLSRQYSPSSSIPNIPVLHSEKSSTLIMDLITFLRFVQNELVLLTSEGAIHKRLQQQLFKSFVIPENPLDSKGWRFGYGRRFNNYPDRFSLIYDYCYHQEWIEERGETLVLTGKGEEIITGKSLLDHLDLFRFWQKLYQKPVRNLSFLLSLISLYTQEWIGLNDLEKEVVPFIVPFYYDREEDIFTKRIIAPLLWLGWLEELVANHHSFVRIAPWAKKIYSFDSN